MTPELHPWNRAFAWHERRGPFRRLSPEQVRRYDAEGWCVVEDAFDAATLAELIGTIDPFEAAATAFLRGRQGGRLFIADADAITFTTHLVARSARLRAFCSGAVFQGIVHDLIGPDVRLYWDQAVYKKPGKPHTFPWHQDNGYTFVLPQQYLTCWVALTDADARSGCPWVAPGLHRRGTLRHWMTDAGWQCLEDPPGAVCVPVRAGSIAVFSSLTPHATGPNTGDAVRKSYIVQFAPDGARALHQAEGAAAPIEVPQDAPERQFPILRSGRPVE